MSAARKRVATRARGETRGRGAKPGLAAVRLLVLDIDGVLTDGRLYYSAAGENLLAFHVRDGHGIKSLLHAGIEVAVISGRKSEAAARRCAELGIRRVLQGVGDKAAAMRQLCAELAVETGFVACIGDDTPDLPMLKLAGHSFAVADAHPEVRRQTMARTRLAGGQGAVREVCDRLLAARGMTGGHGSGHGAHG